LLVGRLLQISNSQLSTTTTSACSQVMAAGLQTSAADKDLDCRFHSWRVNSSMFMLI